MPYIDMDEGHRIGISGDIVSHAKEVFDRGLQLEAVLLVHEYLEQKLNILYKLVTPHDSLTIHRKFKQLIELLLSQNIIAEPEFIVMNDFNKLRNVNSNQILNSSLSLRGAKKGDMSKAMQLASDSQVIIDKLLEEVRNRKKLYQKRAVKKKSG